MQLLPGPEPGLDALDVRARAQALHPDQPLGQVPDAHRGPHIEDRNLAVRLRQRDCLQHQLRRLRVGHEVPSRLTTRHRNWATLADLALEQRYDTALGTEHVSEPYDHAFHPV